MNEKEIKKLFPKKFYLEYHIEVSIGETLLKTFIPEENWEDIFWGLSIGNIGGVKIKTEQTVIWKGEKMKVPLYLDKNLKIPAEIVFELR